MSSDSRGRLRNAVRVSLLLPGWGGMLCIGCGEATGPVGAADIVGTYVLRSVDGRPLPYVLPGSAINLAIYGSRTTFTADGRFTYIDSVASLGDTLRAVTRGGGTWRFVRRGLRGQDVVWTRANDLINGLPQDVEFSYKVRDGGRTLVGDETVTGFPRPAFVYTR